jgi:predicted SprT family Zn-dependent metalloprotease
MDKVDIASVRAIGILREYGIGWNVKVTNSRKTLAVTDHSTSIVELSKRFILLSTLEEFDGIIHHEIAHVLAGPGKGHGVDFVRICKEINPDEKFSCNNFPLRIGLYIYTCPNCGVLGTNELKKDISCVKCLSEGKLVDVEVVKNIIVPTEWASIL